MTPCERLTSKEVQIAILVWQGMTNREVGKIIGTTEQVIKNHLRSTFDKLGVWSRLELARCMWPAMAAANGRSSQRGPTRKGVRWPPFCEAASLECGSRWIYIVHRMQKLSRRAGRNDIFAPATSMFVGGYERSNPVLKLHSVR